MTSLPAWFRNAPLAHKILFANIVAAVIAGAIGLALMAAYAANALRTQLDEQHATEARVLSQLIAPDVSVGDWTGARNLLRSVSSQRNDLAQLAVYGLDGRLNLDADARLGNAASPELPKATATPDHTLHVVPIVHNGARVGQLAWTHDSANRLPGFVWPIALIGAACLAGALLVVWHVLTRVSRPINELGASLRRVASERDYRVRVESNSSDDIGQLAASFNDMMAQLQQRDEALDRELEVRLKIQKRLDHLAHFDSLTGLPNRSQFMLTLGQALQRQGRTGNEVAVLLVDIDNFKRVNDTLGHPVGDTLLKAIAAGFRTTLRGTDVLARLGGDEFGVVVEHKKAAKAASMVAEKLLQYLEAPHIVAGKELHLTASIGIATSPEHGHEADQLVRAADTAMYAAKADGRAQFRHFEPDLDSKAAHRMRLESLLRQALAKRELTLVYQPQMDLRTGRVVAVEALARWRQSELGTLSPDEFIPVAEQTGLIRQLGAWVLAEACRQAQSWRESGRDGPGALRVCVNVSGLELHDARFVEHVKHALEESGLPAGLLELEITETVLVSESLKSIAMLAELRDMGVRIVIDDFGIGYSSMSYLGRLPIGALKIDKSFVASLLSRREDASIVSAIVGLGRGLGLEVIAEGIESEEQLALLADMRCDVVQGYHIAPPLEVDEVVERVRSINQSRPPAKPELSVIRGRKRRERSVRVA
jgi:diguanylate cyclase